MDQQNLLSHNDTSFSIEAMFDYTNRRIWVSDYSFTHGSEFCDFLWQKARESSAQKIIIPARQRDVQTLVRKGFLLEGTAEGFLRGETAFFMAHYPVEKRHYSPALEVKMSELQRILFSPKGIGLRAIPPGYKIKYAQPQDASHLAQFFSGMFSTYPTPLHKTDYILKLMDNGTVFCLALHNDKIAAAAAGEIDTKFSNAEITNCATHPAHQGKGLMTIIMKDLEKTVVNKGIPCLYSLSRASEYGINLILHRIGYKYRGTLVNNCHICGDWEDMHLWVKSTRL